MENRPVIVCSELGFRVHAREILHGLNFEIPRGSFTVVVGENGAGKTTLLKLLMGLNTPSGGMISVLGSEPCSDPYIDRERIAYVAERMSPPIDWSVADFLAFNREFYPGYSGELEEELLKLFRLRRETPFGHLSAGEARRVQVVAALSILPELLLVDEITAVLDIVGRAKFMKAVQEMRARHGTTVVMATNILDDVDKYASHVLLLHRGRLRVQSTKDELVRGSGAATLTAALAELIEKAEAEGG